MPWLPYLEKDTDPGILEEEDMRKIWEDLEAYRKNNEQVKGLVVHAKK